MEVPKQKRDLTTQLGPYFSSRQILTRHLAQTALCFLNIVVRIPPFSDEEELAETSVMLAADSALRKRGLKAGTSTRPAFRRPWVPFQFIDLDGADVPLCDSRHPCRNSRTQYGWFDGAVD